MAGKSTVLRSTAAVALCAMCGLLVPAKSAQVPEFQRVELRTFVGDNPLENMSAFAVEMTEMRYAAPSWRSRSMQAPQWIFVLYSCADSFPVLQ